MMYYLFAALCGGFFNRVRGGLLGIAHTGDTLNAVAFFFFIALMPSVTLIDPDGEFYKYVFTDVHWTTAFFAALAMFAGAAPGWGDYIGALGGWRTDSSLDPLHDVPQIDDLIAKYKTRPRLWGFLGLTIRGAAWGFLIALALNSVWPFVGGALMGVAFWLALKLFGRSFGWQGGEILFGAILWLASVI